MEQLHREIKLQLQNFRKLARVNADTVLLNEEDYLCLEDCLHKTQTAYPELKTYNGCKLIKSSDIKKGSVKVFKDYNNI